MEALVDVRVVDTDAPSITLPSHLMQFLSYQQLCQIMACFCQGSSSEPLSERVPHKMGGFDDGSLC